jgi:hypothetical protein
MESLAEQEVDAAWRVLHRRPYIGIALVAGAALAVATFLGAAEVGFTLLVGYAAYEVLKKGEAPSEALRRVASMKEKLP